MKKIIEEIGEKNFLLLLNHLLVMKRKPFFNSFDDAMECIMERGIYGILIREGVARDEDEAKKIFSIKERTSFFKKIPAGIFSAGFYYYNHRDLLT